MVITIMIDSPTASAYPTFHVTYALSVLTLCYMRYADACAARLRQKSQSVNIAIFIVTPRNNVPWSRRSWPGQVNACSCAAGLTTSGITFSDKTDSVFDYLLYLFNQFTNGNRL